MPAEYKGSEFGPGVKALVITLYRDSGMTECAIERFLKTFGLQISHGKISSILTRTLITATAYLSSILSISAVNSLRTFLIFWCNAPSYLI